MKIIKFCTLSSWLIGVLILVSAGTLNAAPVAPEDWSSARMFLRTANGHMFSDEAISNIKDRYDLVIIEKSHGKFANGFPNTVYSSNIDAEKIRADRPETKVLFYWNSLLLYRHLYQSIIDITAEHPEWVTTQPWWTFDYGWDYSQQDALDWWAGEAIRVVNTTWMNGVFVDAARVQQRPQMQRIKNAINGPVIANSGFNSSYYPYVDGVFVERFVGRNTDTTAEIEKRLDDALAFPEDMYMTLQGRHEYEPSASESGSLGAEVFADHKFSFAAFLIVANDYSYYTYTKDAFYWHEDFEKPLGEPLGKAVKNGYVYTRSFEHLDLTLNIKTGEAKFDWHDAQSFVLTVNNGSGDGDYQRYDVVSISANSAPQGQVFDKWTGNTYFVEDVTDPTTTVTMPNASIRLTATYKTGSSNTPSSAPIGKNIWLKSKANNQFVSADLKIGTYGPLYANRTATGLWERFTVVDAGNGFVALKANANGTYVAALNNVDNAPLVPRYQISRIGAWETFTWIENSDGSISLKANVNGMYVSADANIDEERPLAANRTAIGLWEKFTWGEF